MGVALEILVRTLHVDVHRSLPLGPTARASAIQSSSFLPYCSPFITPAGSRVTAARCRLRSLNSSTRRLVPDSSGPQGNEVTETLHIAGADLWGRPSRVRATADKTVASFTHGRKIARVRLPSRCQ